MIPPTEVVDYAALREEANLVHERLQRTPATSPEAPGLVARGEELARLGCLCQQVIVDTEGTWPS